MKHALLTLMITLFCFAAQGQEPKRITRTISMDDAVVLREIGAVIMPKDGQLAVEIILGNQEKAEADIKKDDIVLMANGKKMKSAKDLRSLYDGVKAGDEFKLGIKRDGNLMMVSFVRKSEEELNKNNHGGMVMRMEKNDGDVVLPALGLILNTKKSAVTVSGTLPSASGNFTSFTPKENDIIVSINGTTVAAAEEFDEIYTELKEGDSVTIVFSRNGKESTETFPKPKPMGRKIMMSR